MWASAIQEAVRKMEKREVTLETTSGMLPGLHIGYEKDFLDCQPSQVPKIFSDPKFLPSVISSVYDLAMPSTGGEVIPFHAAAKKSTSSAEPAAGPSGTTTPKTSPSASPTKTVVDSDTDLAATPVTIELDQPPSHGVSSRSCLLYTSPSPRDATLSRMPSSA